MSHDLRRRRNALKTETQKNPKNNQQRVERMKERVKNLSTPARRPTAACDVMNSANGVLLGHVSFAPGVGGTPHPIGTYGALPHTPASRSALSTAAHKTPGGAQAGMSATHTPGPAYSHVTPKPSALSVPPSSAPRTHTATHKTPHSGGGGGIRSPTDALLIEYLRSNHNLTPPFVRSERERLIASVRENPTAQTWCAFLETEEAGLGDDTMTATGSGNDKTDVSVRGRNGVSLFRLFEHATRSLPSVSRTASHETQGYYLRLFLGLARQVSISHLPHSAD